MNEPIKALEMFDMLDEAIRPHQKDCDHPRMTEDNGQAYCPICEYRQDLAPDEYVDAWGDVVSNTTEPHDLVVEDGLINAEDQE
jgi:hypothetical protein